MLVWVSPLNHDHKVEIFISVVLWVKSGLCSKVVKARKQQEKIGLMQMVTSIYILTKLTWRLAEMAKKWATARLKGLSHTEKEFRTASLCPHFLPLTLHTPFFGCAICWTRSFVFSHLSPISVLCRTHSLSLQAVCSTHPPTSLFSALSRHICCSSPPDLFFYFWLLVSFWMPTLFLFTGVLTPGTLAAKMQWVSLISCINMHLACSYSFTYILIINIKRYSLYMQQNVFLLWFLFLLVHMLRKTG